MHGPSTKKYLFVSSSLWMGDRQKVCKTGWTGTGLELPSGFETKTWTWTESQKGVTSSKNIQKSEIFSKIFVCVIFTSYGRFLRKKKCDFSFKKISFHSHFIGTPAKSKNASVLTCWFKITKKNSPYSFHDLKTSVTLAMTPESGETRDEDVSLDGVVNRCYFF